LAAHGAVPPQAASSKSLNEDDAVSAVTQPPALTGGMVSLKDVTSITPIESEAETLLLNALEEKQSDVVETNALNNLTKEEESLFTNQSQSQRALPKSAKPSLFSKSAAKDTTQHLWELTRQMKKNGTVSRTSSLEEIPSSNAAGQSDLLALHAVKLLSKRKSMAKASTTSPPSSEAVGASGTGQKWNKLRLAVQNNMTGTEDPKKNDDHVVPNQVIMTDETTKQTSSRNDIEQGTFGAFDNQESGEEGAVPGDGGPGNESNGEMRTSKMQRDQKDVNSEFHAFR
jgi:hypothetical protein